MNRLQIALLIAGCTASCASALAQRFASDEHRAAHEHGWMFNYDEAKALARQTNRPMMVVFRCVP